MYSVLRELPKYGCSFYLKEAKLFVRLFLNDKSDETLNDISKILSRLTADIHRLEVFLSGKNREKPYSSSVLRNLFRAISKFHSTQELILDVSHNNMDIVGAENLHFVLANLRILDYLELNLVQTNLSDFDLGKIFSAFRHLRNLKDLRLDVRGNKLTNLSAKIIGSSMSNMTQIKRLNLDISGNNIDEDGVWEIISGILHIHNLETLKFVCRSCRISANYRNLIQNSLIDRVKNLTLIF